MTPDFYVLVQTAKILTTQFRRYGFGKSSRILFSPNVLILLFALLFAAFPASAQQSIWTSKQAHDALEKGEIVLLDLRTPEEWRETGVPAGAWPVNLYDKNFGRYLGKIIDRNPSITIGLICATGGRSSYVLGALQRNGLRNFVDIREGILGSEYGPGWRKAGLPLVSSDQAMSGMPADFVKR